MTANADPPLEPTDLRDPREAESITRGVEQLSSIDDSGVWRTPPRGQKAPLTSDASATADPPRLPWPDLVLLVRAQMRSLVGPSRDAEDLTQTALEQIVRSIDRFEGRCELTTFTYRIATRVAINHWRSLRRYFRCFVLGEPDVPDPPITDSETDPIVQLERQRAARLHHHLDRLAADHRVVVVLADLEELPASRIADILDCPENTVRSRLKRARAELTRRLLRDPLFAEPTGDVTSKVGELSHPRSLLSESPPIVHSRSKTKGGGDT